MPRVLDRWVVVAAGAWALLIGWVTGRAGFSAKFGPIDDHQVVRWAQWDGRVSWSDVGHALPGQLGIDRFTDLVRFRPAYEVLRLLEARAFGTRPGWWYAERTLLSVFVVTASACVATAVILRAGGAGTRAGPAAGPPRFLGRWVPCAVALVFATAVSGIEAWNDVVTRLGPSELHAAVGLAVLVIGGYGAVVDGRTRWWVTAGVGLVLAVWAKENMAVLLLPTAPVLVVGARRHDCRRRALAVGVAGVAAALVVAVAVGPALLRRGTDVYGRDLGGDRLSGMVGFWESRPDYLVVPLVYLALLVGWAWWFRRRTGRVAPPDRVPIGRRDAAPWVALAVSLPAVQILDLFFAAGALTDLRYQLLSGLMTFAEVVTLVALVAFATRSVATTSTSESSGDRQSVRTALATLTATVLLAAPLVVVSVPVLHQRAAVSSRNREETIAFQRFVGALADDLRGDPRSTLVIVVDEPWKTELPWTLATNLRSRGVAPRRVGAVLVPSARSGDDRGAVPLLPPPWRSERILGAGPGAARVCLYVFATSPGTPVPACAGARTRSWFTGGWWTPVPWSSVSWRWFVPGL